MALGMRSHVMLVLLLVPAQVLATSGNVTMEDMNTSSTETRRSDALRFLSPRVDPESTVDVVATSTKVYNLKVQSSKKCLDMRLDNHDKNVNHEVYMHDCHVGTNQKWYFSGSEFKNLAIEDMCLEQDVRNGNVYTHRCHGGKIQQWYLSGDRLKSRLDDKCLDHDYSNDNVYVHACHNEPTANQLWDFQQVQCDNWIDCRLIGVDMSNWMASLKAEIYPRSILDLSLPASHDTLTYDLSPTTPLCQDLPDAQNIEQPLWLATCSLLDDSLDLQQVARNQALDIKSQLDSGIRYIDFRMTLSTLCPTFEEKLDLGKYIAKQDLAGKIEFYGTHFFQTRHPAMVYLRELKQWLDEHPGEIVVMLLSSHGDQTRGCKHNGEQQYRDPWGGRHAYKFWQSFKRLFGSLLINVKNNPVETTSVQQLVDSNSRLLVYAAGFCELQGGYDQDDGMAYDAKTFYESPGWKPGFAAYEPNLRDIEEDFKNAAQKLNDYKPKSHFYARTLVTSFDKDQLVASLCEAAAPRTITNLIGDCSKQVCIHSPISTSPICHPILWDVVTISNFFFQWPLSASYQKGYVLPNAAYVDGVRFDGIDIGSGRVFRYQKMVVLANLKSAQTTVRNPIRFTWDDGLTGRYASAPVYMPTDGSEGICFDPVRVYQEGNSKCKDVAQCNTPGRTGYKYNAGEVFPSEGPDCYKPIYQEDNPCNKCQCYYGGVGTGCTADAQGCNCYNAGVGKGCLNHGCGETECDSEQLCIPPYNCRDGTCEL
jgi:hypothetical protein